MTGKQLKNSILQWAIQGKLVPQDPNDEPASVLLERIRVEKARLVKEGKIKKDKNESIIFRGEDNSYYEKFADGKVVCIDDEIPFEIPEGWVWCRLGNCVSPDCSLSYGIVQPMNDVLGGIPVVRPVDMNAEIVTLKGLKHVAKEISDSYQRTILKGNEILFCVRGTVGKISIASSELKGANVTRGISPIRLDTDSQKIYCYYCLQSPYVMMQIDEYTKGAALKQINIEDLKNITIPLPPLAEQYRIVYKIQELLPIVEQYSNSQLKLANLNCGIKQLLKKSILQEAIQGKLVSQDPDDESASTLLVRIKEEKLRLVKERKLKKKDIFDSVIFKSDDNKYYEKVNGEEIDISNEIPFEIPDSWVWTRLGFITSNETGLSYNKEFLNDKTQPFIRVLRGGNIEEGRWFTQEDDVKISHKYVKESLLLKKGTFITPSVTSIERMAKTALIEVDQDDTVVGGFVLMIKPFVLTTTFLQYLNLFFQTTYYKLYCIGITNKSGQAFYNLSRQKLMKCFVPIPPLEEQRRIVEVLSLLSL